MSLSPSVTLLKKIINLFPNRETAKLHKGEQSDHLQLRSSSRDVSAVVSPCQDTIRKVDGIR